MKLVINVPDEMIEALKQGCFDTKYSIYDLCSCVMNGTPLPQGCDKLVDASKLEYFRCADNKCDSAYDVKCQTCEYSIVYKYQIDNAYINL
jgi:hypothetical protein